MSDIDTSTNNADTSAQPSTAPVASVPGQTESPASTPGPADTADGEQKAQDEGDDKPKPQRDRRAEKRIASLTRKNEELLTRLGRLEGIVEITTKAQQPAEADAKPQPSQFRSYDEYVEALTDWKTEEKLKARDAARADQSRNQAETSKVSERNARVAERLMEDAKDIEDFDEVMQTITAPNFPISVAMRDYLEEAERPALMAEWLSENPDRAKLIYGMNAAATVRELDKVAKGFAARSAQTSKAPPPVPTVGGRSVTTRDPEKMSMEDYANHWHQRKAKSH